MRKAGNEHGDCPVRGWQTRLRSRTDCWVKALTCVRTIRDAADSAGKEIIIEEDLREREIGQIGGLSFQEAKQKVYVDAAFAFPGGESSLQARHRAAQVIRKLLDEHAGKRIVIGTHGDIMTLMLGEFDLRFDYAFWESTSMPDIYKTEWEGEILRQVTRMWKE